MEKAARLVRRSSGMFGKDKDKDKEKEKHAQPGYTTDDEEGGSVTRQQRSSLAPLTTATKTTSLPDESRPGTNAADASHPPGERRKADRDAARPRYL